jgi:hypothetical protein
MSWSVPRELSDFFSDPVAQRDSRAPAEPGLYVLSERRWTASEPTSQDEVLYVGQGGNLRFRIGQLTSEVFGFTGEDPRYAGSYYHSGGHRVWHHCVTHEVPVQSLCIAWFTGCRCLDCGEVRLIKQLKPRLNSRLPETCADHSPVLSLSEALPRLV